MTTYRDTAFDEPIGFDPEVRRELAERLEFSPHLVADTETTGNYPELDHKIVSGAMFDLLDPDKNFMGECHVADGGKISTVDIIKNVFGRDNNLVRIINPHGNYGGIDDFIQPPLWGSRKAKKDFERFRGLAQSVLGQRQPGKDFIESSAADFGQAMYNWMRSYGMFSGKEFSHYQEFNEAPVITVIGQNTQFDIAFLNQALAAAGIQSIATARHRESYEDEPKLLETPRPYKLAYRGIEDVGSNTKTHIRMLDTLGLGDAVRDFWYKSQSNTGQRKLVPMGQGQSTISLDAAGEFWGLEPRPDFRFGAEHDPMDDALRAGEIYARQLVGKPYLERFANQPIPELALIAKHVELRE